jgi:solute:Na+ symporter, SSS family
LQGLVIAGLLAALMSTVAGALNSTATLVSIDIVRRARPDTSEQALVRIGQGTVVVVMALAMLWSTQGERFGGIFKGINQMIAVLAPPISVVFIWGIFWPRATSAAALATLIFGFVLGTLVFALDFPAASRFVLGVDPDGQIRQLFTRTLGIPFMLQAGILFGLCSLVLVGVSFATPPPEPQRIDRCHWKNPWAVLTEKSLSSVFDARVLALLLVITMFVCYRIFA